MAGIHFYNKKEKYFVTTNFKVMYSNLNRQPNLKKVRNYKVFLNLILNKISLGKPHYLLVRPVEARLESFYKNKFVRGATVLTKIPKEEWQKSLMVFFPYLDIDMSEDAEKIAEKIKSVDFNKMVSVLENVADMDGHTRPQSAALSLFFLKKDHPIKFNEILDISKPSDYQQIATKLKLDTSIVSNSSKNTKENIQWSDESRNIVRKIYADDYHLLEKLSS